MIKKLFWKNINTPNLVLRNYDKFVNKFNCNYVWKCNENIIKDLYKSNISKNHLEIGPGTGYFLKSHLFNTLNLVDINKSHLNQSKKNLLLNTNKIFCYHNDIFNTDFKTQLPPVSSVGLSYVLHCIDGRLDILLNNLINNVSQSNVIFFGSTVLPIESNIIAKTELLFLNYFNIFNNYNHNFNDLSELKSKFDCDFKIIGNVLVFKIKT